MLEIAMNIVDYFNPYNVKHIDAYHVLQDTGAWPKNFVPSGTEFPPTWHVSLTAKLASAWLDYVGKVWKLMDHSHEYAISFDLKSLKKKNKVVEAIKALQYATELSLKDASDVVKSENMMTVKSFLVGDEFRRILDPYASYVHTTSFKML